MSAQMDGHSCRLMNPAQASLLAQQGALSLQAVALLGQVDPQEPVLVTRVPLSGGQAKQGCPAQ